jgi:hypothetical protein
MGERDPIEWPPERLEARRRFLFLMGVCAEAGVGLALLTRSPW